MKCEYCGVNLLDTMAVCPCCGARAPEKKVHSGSAPSRVADMYDYIQEHGINMNLRGIVINEHAIRKNVLGIYRDKDGYTCVYAIDDKGFEEELYADENEAEACKKFIYHLKKRCSKPLVTEGLHKVSEESNGAYELIREVESITNRVGRSIMCTVKGIITIAIIVVVLRFAVPIGIHVFMVLMEADSGVETTKNVETGVKATYFKGADNNCYFLYVNYDRDLHQWFRWYKGTWITYDKEPEGSDCYFLDMPEGVKRIDTYDEYRTFMDNNGEKYRELDSYAKDVNGNYYYIWQSSTGDYEYKKYIKNKKKWKTIDTYPSVEMLDDNKVPSDILMEHPARKVSVDSEK